MYNVKQVSQITGISVHTIRYYTNLELIPHLKRDSYNCRLFDEEAIEWLKGITYLRELGLSLKDIKEVISLYQRNDDEALNLRVQFYEEQIIKANEELERAKLRVSYIENKLEKEMKIAAHLLEDSKNPNNRYKK